MTHHRAERGGERALGSGERFCLLLCIAYGGVALGMGRCRDQERELQSVVDKSCNLEGEAARSVGDTDFLGASASTWSGQVVALFRHLGGGNLELQTVRGALFAVEGQSRIWANVEHKARTSLLTSCGKTL